MFGKDEISHFCAIKMKIIDFIFGESNFEYPNSVLKIAPEFNSKEIGVRSFNKIFHY